MTRPQYLDTDRYVPIKEGDVPLHIVRCTACAGWVPADDIIAHDRWHEAGCPPIEDPDFE